MRLRDVRIREPGAYPRPCDLEPPRRPGDRIGRPTTSGFGTKRTWRDVRLESAFKGKAEVRLRARQVSF